jgi:NADH:ubiquinone oxidoreductase subunit F (NADH-binding)
MLNLRRTDHSALDDLVDRLERAQVHGHGGAYFPTATKLRAVAAGRGRPVVVVNGSEGEPLSRKDRFLLATHTGLVVDGALAAARALGSDTIIIAIDRRRRRVIEVVQTVLASRPELTAAGVAVEVAGVPAGYVTGQESALVSFLNGRGAKPTSTPPYVFEQGVRGRPTLVSNVETFVQIARVLDGTYDRTRYVTVSGAVEKTAIVKIAPYTTVADALLSAGAHADDLSTVLLGGYAGRWVSAQHALALPLDEPALRQRGLTLGAGIIFAMGDSECGVSEVARVTRWMAGETAGQCGPCVFGLDAIAGALERLCGLGGQRGELASLAQIERWCTMVTRRGGCAHPDGVANYVSSALSVMRESFQSHAVLGPCERCAVSSGPRPLAARRIRAGTAGAAA